MPAPRAAGPKPRPAAARSGNPSVRAAAELEPEPDTPEESEGAGAARTFEFDGLVWDVLQFKPLKFQRLYEAGALVAALQLAIGEDAYEQMEDLIDDTDQILEVLELIAQAVGGGSTGESRASRRSSGRTARR